MHRTPITSSSILSVGYDSALETLEIEFHNGSIYQYDHLPPHEHHALVSAASTGTYFNLHIRDRYQHRRV